MDISTRVVVDTYDIAIIDPATKAQMRDVESGELCSVTAYGPGSAAFAAARSAQSTRRMARLQSKGQIDTTPDEDRIETATFLTSITVSFNNFTYGEAKASAMFQACYEDPKAGWLTVQVNAGAGDWGNFMQAA